MHPRSFVLLYCLPAYRWQQLPISERQIRYVAVLSAALREKWSHLSWTNLVDAHFFGGANDFSSAAQTISSLLQASRIDLHQ